jgi:hypothetical protein
MNTFVLIFGGLGLLLAYVAGAYIMYIEGRRKERLYLAELKLDGNLEYYSVIAEAQYEIVEERRQRHIRGF